MGMLGSVVLALLGALACDALLAEKRPSLRFWLQAISPLSGLLGVGAAANGLFCVIKMLAYLAFIRYAPVIYLANLAAGVASVLLGIRYGHSTAMVWLGGRLNAKQKALFERAHAFLVENEDSLGPVGLGLGVFCALLNLFT